MMKGGTLRRQHRVRDRGLLNQTPPADRWRCPAPLSPTVVRRI
ncbi:MAG: hypothetical protein N2652_03040 [Kiritimatiellae bacterium]|nr:hypothetical protein [Kiritimatiellia bacterium]